jgi:hypothetical protein
VHVLAARPPGGVVPPRKTNFVLAKLLMQI